jgi:hypothetical protein
MTKTYASSSKTKLRFYFKLDFVFLAYSSSNSQVSQPLG